MSQTSKVLKTFEVFSYNPDSRPITNHQLNRERFDYGVSRAVKFTVTKTSF